MNTACLESLATAWREEADLLRRRGLEREANMAESYAADLEARIREWLSERLTLEEASDEIGIGYAAVQKRIERGQLTNAGRKGRPRVRRCDLYGSSTPRLETGEPDLAAEVLISRRTDP